MEALTMIIAFGAGMIAGLIVGAIQLTNFTEEIFENVVDEKDIENVNVNVSGKVLESHIDKNGVRVITKIKLDSVGIIKIPERDHNSEFLRNLKENNENSNSNT